MLSDEHLDLHKGIRSPEMINDLINTIFFSFKIYLKKSDCLMRKYQHYIEEFIKYVHTKCLKTITEHKHRGWHGRIIL